ncbi:hypothetical protein [Dyella choica]|uniref:hypothetical protein n=1 Tax=Dyella choica TaxID=1927959 RepID=UPI001E475B53|nr:hypothetical protein [Dyella choica]
MFKRNSSACSTTTPEKISAGFLPASSIEMDMALPGRHKPMSASHWLNICSELPSVDNSSVAEAMAFTF